MALAQKSMGTQLWLTSGDDSPMRILNLTNIGEAGLESEEMDVTDLDSPDDFREFIAGVKDGGEIPIEGFVKSEANQEKLLELANSREVCTWEIRYPSGAKWFITAFVKMFKKGADAPDTARTFTGTLRVSGAPVYASSGISA